MFDTPADATAFLEGFFEKPFVEEIVGALAPALSVRFVDTPAKVGQTRIGGAPDMAAGAEWPKPARPADPAGLAARGNEDAGREMLAHIEQDLPYAFIAQIDLGELAGDPAAEDLPAEGRLLFFYDLAIGPWDTGTRVGRVVHDATPIGELTTLEVPPALAAADAEQKRQAAEFAAQMAEEYGESGEALPGGSIYLAPARSAEISPALQMPSPFSTEIARLPKIEAAARGGGDPEGEELLTSYQDALEEAGDTEGGPSLQLLGSPRPEQDDPRYDAVVVSRFGKQHLTQEEWAEHRDEVMGGASEWRLLFQFAVGGWMMDDYGTGTVYYLIRDEDLRNERFDGVVTVYQQT